VRAVFDATRKPSTTARAMGLFMFVEENISKDELLAKSGAKKIQ
jgi:hypothetical protein